MTVHDSAGPQGHQHNGREGHQQRRREQETQQSCAVGQQQDGRDDLGGSDAGGDDADQPRRHTEAGHGLAGPVPVHQLGDGADREHGGEGDPDDQCDGSHDS